MGLFGSKDWNVVAIIFERPDMYRVNGNRGKGGEATTIRDNVQKHPRTIFWAVFDQKGAFLEGAPAAGSHAIAATTLQRLIREVAANPTVREVLSVLEKGKEKSASKALVWNGYPAKGESK
ncbi:MAG: hypothetical protein ACKV0T_06445 [Planctomycetales bacterium]